MCMYLEHTLLATNQIECMFSMGCFTEKKFVDFLYKKFLCNSSHVMKTNAEGEPISDF